MSLVCSVIFIHHAFNANILDKDYAFSDGEILMVDNAVRTNFEPYERHFKEIGFNENTIKKYLQCTNIQTVTVPVPAKFLRASNVPTGLLNEIFVRHQSDDYPHNPNTEDLSQFSYTVRNNDYSLVYTVENNQLGLYKLTDLQQKDNLAAANPQVVKEMQGVVREFIDSSQPPLSEVNQEKFNNIKKALSEAK